MPMYEFVCDGCQNQFEELVFSSDEQVPCPKCGSPRVTRVLSICAVKGDDGFRSTAHGGGGCSGCKPGPGGCSGCH